MASKRHLRRKCASKKTYTSYEEARASLAKHPVEATGRLHVYRCDICHKWHLGHRPGWLNRILRTRRREA